MTKRILLALLVTLFAANTASAEYVTYPTNKDGSIITGVLTAGFDPLNQAGLGPVYPFPFNLFYLDLDTFSFSEDFTLVVPAEDPDNFGDPLVALGAMDGFSTTEKWTTSFIDGYYNQSTSFRPPGNIDPASVIPGQSVRVFHVNAANPLILTGIVRELVPGVDFVAVAATSSVLAIIPLKPLPELSTFLAVLTNDIKDTRGNNATPDSTYFSLKRTTPWVDENGNSTYSLVPDDLAQTLETVRPIINNWEDIAEAGGVVREDIILSWTVQTESVTPVLKNVRSIAKPAPTTVGPTGMNTSALGGAGIADIYAGIITMPYYLGVPSAENPTAAITDFWTGEPGAYVPPFDASLPDTTSTHITVANPFPVQTGMQTVPLLVSVPNASSGQQKPAAGWPVVIFGHGLTGSRAHMLAVADSAAAAGYAVIAIDFPMHGISPDDPLLAGLHIENTPFAPIANERTFDVDLVDNATGAPGPDGVVDASGTHWLNLASLLTTRDNIRQGIADLSVLAVSIPFIDLNGDSLPDFDGSNIPYAGFSLGGISGTAFAAIEPMVNRAFLSVPAGGLMRAFEASPTFGPRIRAGLSAFGIEPGTADYELFLTVAQTVLDSADPINWGAEASRHNAIVLHEVIGDSVLPNYVLTAPLSGTEPLIATMGLASYSSTQVSPNGVRLAGRFMPPADHGSLLSPVGSPEATIEMQKQLASFLATKGTTVIVNDAATMVPVPEAVEEKSPESVEEQNTMPEKADVLVKKQKLTGKKGG
jgi:pimeloyl-ACP methyl ester carboxylesterase